MNFHQRAEYYTGGYAHIPYLRIHWWPPRLCARARALCFYPNKYKIFIVSRDVFSRERATRR